MKWSKKKITWSCEVAAIHQFTGTNFIEYFSEFNLKFCFFSSDKHNKNDLFSRFWWYFISNLSGFYVFFFSFPFDFDFQS